MTPRPPPPHATQAPDDALVIIEGAFQAAAAAADRHVLATELSNITSAALDKQLTRSGPSSLARHPTIVLSRPGVGVR